MEVPGLLMGFVLHSHYQIHRLLDFLSYLFVSPTKLKLIQSPNNKSLLKLLHFKSNHDL